MITYISRLVGRTPSKAPPDAVVPALPLSPLTPVGVMVADLRTTLRLTGLLPLYILAKSLIQQRNNPDKDKWLYRISLVQCAGYIGFQSLENIYHLTNKAVLSPTVMATRGGPAAWVRWSCRSWLVAVSSDFFRLWRESVLLQNRRDRGEKISESEQKEIDRKWYAELMTAASWFPVAVHYSLDGGLSWMNPGLVGFFGMMAGLNNFRLQWAATKG
jgi:Peroxisomal biogenesis factor 11 (PEX11)